MSTNGHANPAFVEEGLETGHGTVSVINIGKDTSICDNNIHERPKKCLTEVHSRDELISIESSSEVEERSTWGSGLEFLMSCIAMSIGLGNVWRFPFTAYQNGGGAFLIPYVIVLFLVGKPIYYLEMILGQFASKSSVKVWNIMPSFRGIGYAQMYSMSCIVTYYCALMAITLLYLFNSFRSVLPWATCLPEWGEGCIDSAISHHNSSYINNQTNVENSATLYFKKVILQEKDNIDDGIGMPDWRLMICLFLSWCCISGILIGGVKSTGKASYFLAIFPYVVMIALLIRAVTLPGAMKGIMYFIKPTWSKLADVQVWYAAVTQCFFSLSVCFGSIIMFSSYNTFHYNIYRDVMVVTTLDTFTSLLAGFTIFGILGNLAYELDSEVDAVARPGAGLAFISYPDAIAKFTIVPQLFSVLFFLMLFTLGIGSGVGILGGVIVIIKDQFPHWKHWCIVVAISIIGFCIGTVYCTPGGQFILSLVDYYGASFVVFSIAIFEMVVIFWIYGLENFLDDVEFMLNKRPSCYWRISWVIFTPTIILAILIYTLMTMSPLQYAGTFYPNSAYIAGWILLAVGALQIPFWFLYTMFSRRHLGISKMFLTIFEPRKDWGPLLHTDAWRTFKEMKMRRRKKRVASSFIQFFYVLFEQEDKLSS